jgi:hypothetical protein
MNETFDDFLMEYFCEKVDEGRMALDDDLPDAFEAWLERLEAGDIMELAEEAIIYYKKQYENIKKNI